MCGRELVSGEGRLCIHCVGNIPLWKGSMEELRLHRLPRTAPIAGVWPWMAYTNSNPICSLIRQGKFNDRPELIEELAHSYALWLIDEGHLEGIDGLVPVPMHWWKRLCRGYNQAEIIAEAISKASGIPVMKAIRATKSHKAQSTKSGAERAANVSGIFALRSRHFSDEGLSLAMVDDILTTGSTISEAITALEPLKPSSITVLTLAATRL